jgi:hypothetical protein
MEFNTQRQKVVFSPAGSAPGLDGGAGIALYPLSIVLFIKVDLASVIRRYGLDVDFIGEIAMAYRRLNNSLAWRKPGAFAKKQCFRPYFKFIRIFRLKRRVFDRPQQARTNGRGRPELPATFYAFSKN